MKSEKKTNKQIHGGVYWSYAKMLGNIRKEISKIIDPKDPENFGRFCLSYDMSQSEKMKLDSIRSVLRSSRSPRKKLMKIGEILNQDNDYRNDTSFSLNPSTNKLGDLRYLVNSYITYANSIELSEEEQNPRTISNKQNRKHSISL